MIDNDYNSSITWSKTHPTLPPIEIYSFNAFLDHFKFQNFLIGGTRPHAPLPVPAPLAMGAERKLNAKFWRPKRAENFWCLLVCRDWIKDCAPENVSSQGTQQSLIFCNCNSDPPPVLHKIPKDSQLFPRQREGVY